MSEAVAAELEAENEALAEAITAAVRNHNALSGAPGGQCRCGLCEALAARNARMEAEK